MLLASDDLKNAQERIHRSLLNLGAGLPARECCLCNQKISGKRFLRQTKGFPLCANLRWLQQPRLIPKGIAEPPASGIIQDDGAAILAPRYAQIGEHNVILSPVVLQVCGIRGKHDQVDGTLTTLATFPREGLQDSNPSSVGTHYVHSWIFGVRVVQSEFDVDTERGSIHWDLDNVFEGEL